jgi:hypothetical protein
MQVAAFVTKEETKDKQGPMTPNLLTLMKPEKDMSTVKCFRCKKKGHLVNKCPQKAADHTEENVMIAMDEILEVLPDEVLLDTQANISLFHPSALQGVQESETTIRVNGIGGYQMTVSKKVRLPGFFDVYCHEGIKVNVLCFVDVEDMYELS